MNNIEILENFIDKQKSNKGTFVATDFEITALENLIKEYKELNEKNKKWEELYDEDQKYITQLNNKIFQLETDNKKLDKENQGLFEAYNFNDTNLFAKTLKEYRKEILNSIPKSKVKEKIEELDKRKRKSQIEYSTIDELIFDKKIEVLQELLEKGELYE